MASCSNHRRFNLTQLRDTSRWIMKCTEGNFVQEQLVRAFVILLCWSISLCSGQRQLSVISMIRFRQNVSTRCSSFICFCKRQLLLALRNHVIYFSQSQFLLIKTSKDGEVTTFGGTMSSFGELVFKLGFVQSN